MNKITPQDCLNDIHRAIKINKEMFSDLEKQMAYDEMIELEIDDAIQEKHEKRNAEYCDILENQQFRWKGGQ